MSTRCPECGCLRDHMEYETVGTPVGHDQIETDYYCVHCDLGDSCPAIEHPAEVGEETP